MYEYLYIYTFTYTYIYIYIYVYIHVNLPLAVQFGSAPAVGALTDGLTVPLTPTVPIYS
jgi:hypothetical protein